MLEADTLSPAGKNFHLLWKVYDHIVAHPEEWRQGMWATKTDCGTAYCFAGHAVTMTHPNARPVWLGGHACRFADGSGFFPYDTVARAELGLSVREADCLFGSLNSLQDIHDLIMQWEQWENRAIEFG